MPRDGAGTYSLVAGNPVVTNTTISSTVQNNTTSDLATALTASIAKDGQTTPTANIPLGGFKLTGVGAATARTDAATLASIQDGTGVYAGSASGTDTILLTLSPVITAYVAGQRFYFIPAGANTGAVTVNINSLGAKAITKAGTTALIAGDIPASATITIIYDGTQFQLAGVQLDVRALFTAIVTNVQTFTANDTWTKPTGAKTVQVICVGAGGGGGGARGAAAGGVRQGGAGGGGGATASGTFNAADLGATETITIGAGGAAGAGGSSADGAVGSVGGNSSFGSRLTAYGGGGGGLGSSATSRSGGGGGGTGGVGGAGGTSQSTGGSPNVTLGSSGIGGAGASGNSADGSTGLSAEYGGASGASTRAGGEQGLPGNQSIYGGASGGSGGGVTAANAESIGGAGGLAGGFGTAGGGGAGGAVNGGAGTAGAAGTGIVMGSGGGGGGSQDSGTGGAGGAGGAPGGGAGGGGGGTIVGGAGGLGARGEVRVYSYF